MAKQKVLIFVLVILQERKIFYFALLTLFSNRASSWNWQGTSLFEFKNIYVTKHASLYASQDILDFYAGII